MSGCSSSTTLPRSGANIVNFITMNPSDRENFWPKKPAGRSRVKGYVITVNMIRYLGKVWWRLQDIVHWRTFLHRESNENADTYINALNFQRRSGLSSHFVVWKKHTKCWNTSFLNAICVVCTAWCFTGLQLITRKRYETQHKLCFKHYTKQFPVVS